MLADFRVFRPYGDFVLGNYIDVVVVVYDHVCGCCVLIIHGDKLMCRKHMVVCMYAGWPNGGDALMLFLVFILSLLLLFLLILVVVVFLLFMVTF